MAGTGTLDAAATAALRVEALAADAIGCMVAETLLASADHGTVGTPLAPNAGHADAALEELRREGVDDAELADRLQREGVEREAIACDVDAKPREGRATKVSVKLTRQAIKDAPTYDPAMAPDRAYEVGLYEHYGRPGYWADDARRETEIARL